MLDTLAIQLRVQGANIHTKIQGETSHIIMIVENQERLKEINVRLLFFHSSYFFSLFSLFRK